jgi:hypothetical protein
MTVRFKIRRLLGAVAVFGIVLAVMRPVEMTSIVIALWIAIPLAIIVLAARKRHISDSSESLSSCAIGMIAGVLCFPVDSPPVETLA